MSESLPPLADWPGRVKILVNGRSCHGGTHTWALPESDDAGGWTPGAWTPTVPDPILCNRGWHLTTAAGTWEIWAASGMTVYAAEGEGERGRAGDKAVYQRARLLHPLALPAWWQRAETFIRELPAIPWFHADGDPDPAWCLFTAPTPAAARGAARGAAGGAAWDAAWDAARGAAGGAAWDAAWDAARGAAGVAARDAAWAAARGAAGVAARAAARDAAWAAARGAARGAAWDAAWDAAWGAAEDGALLAGCLTVADLIAPEHLAYAQTRQRVWQKGYGLLRDVDGVLYVYGVEAG